MVVDLEADSEEDRKQQRGRLFSLVELRAHILSKECPKSRTCFNCKTLFMTF